MPELPQSCIDMCNNPPKQQHNNSADPARRNQRQDLFCQDMGFELIAHMPVIPPRQALRSGPFRRMCADMAISQIARKILFRELPISASYMQGAPLFHLPIIVTPPYAHNKNIK
jgi:hypothetical protein